MGNLSMTRRNSDRHRDCHLSLSESNHSRTKRDVTYSWLTISMKGEKVGNLSMTRKNSDRHRDCHLNLSESNHSRTRITRNKSSLITNQE